ncbi:MAG: extracellular solute-binding protein [Armatimonadota bacterium]|nr:extracellular solute-binding protein [Armatimonadota bacterium]MDR7485965.1 extracellular solute-binding protein [Armatimonadota bacterium]MDR7532157.1 extracellular solute-binding protein [Armatimonadota bacterium]MDR7537307.1 extracellular solute-binding protein [Armatimonadota bacterium]
MDGHTEERWVQVDHGRWRRVSRRDFLKLTAAGAAAARLSPFANVQVLLAQQRRLTILHWSHFVPGYDRWFDNEYVKEWGRANSVEVVVDHIPFGQIPARAAAEVAARSGHDLYQHISPPSVFEPEVEDLTDIVEPLVKKYGIIELAKRSSYNPKTKKWFGLSNSWVPDPAHYRKDLWDEVGFVPDSWDNVLQAGRKLKARGVPVGLGISNDIDANMALRDIMWSFGATTQNANHEVVINSKNTVEALKFTRALFKEAMDPEVLAWDASSNNRAMLAGKVSYVYNAISIARTAEKEFPELSPKIQIWKPPRGPQMLGGKRLGAEHVMLVYTIWRFLPAERKRLAKQFLVDFINNWGRAFKAAELYEFPSFTNTVPADQLRAAVLNDPAAAREGNPNKYRELLTAHQWSTNVGHPGYANAAEGEAFDTFIIPQMFAQVCTDKMSPEDAARWAEAQMKPIWAKWKQRGLM